MIEMITVMVMIGVLAALAVPMVRDYSDRQRDRQAARAVAREVTLTRGYAIRTGKRVALVANEAERSLVVRDTAGTTYRWLYLGDDSDIRAEAIDLKLPGDSLVFGARGVCLNCSPGVPVEIDVDGKRQSSLIRINMLGRTQIQKVGG